MGNDRADFAALRVRHDAQRPLQHLDADELRLIITAAAHGSLFGETVRARLQSFSFLAILEEQDRG